MARGKKLPRKPILLTFDDASDGQYTRALPILEHHFIATFFVMTVVLGKPGWMTKGQVKALDRAGMTIGAHTYDHKSVPEYTSDDFETAARPSPAASCARSSATARALRVPVRAYSASAIPHLCCAGYRAAFQLADKLDKQHPLWSIRRIIVPELTASSSCARSGRISRAVRTEYTGGRWVAALNQLAPASAEPKTSPDVAPK